MNKLFLDNDKILDYELLTDQNVNNCFYHDIVIYFILEGEMRLTSGGEVFTLKSKDFILMNTFQYHSYQMTDHTLAIGFIISIAEFSKYSDLSNIEFRCNSLIGDPKQYHPIRRLLEICISNYYGKRAGNSRTLMRLNSIYYQIIEALFSGFTLHIVDDSMRLSANTDEARIHDIISYIHLNYTNAISLNDLAEKFYMSTAYISRYIKKHLGQNFGEYLAQVRLEHAVHELTTGEKAIVRIAMDNGFPNISSFNKIFKEHFGMTPKAYQEQSRNKEEKEASIAAEHIVSDMEYRLMDYLDEEDDPHQPVTGNDGILRSVELDVKQFHYVEKSWSRLVNVGRFVSVLRGDVQEHLLLLREKLEIEYVRMWDLYDEELKLNANHPTGQHNFSKLDKIIDFLINHKMRPYFELGFKPNILFLENHKFIFHETREILFASPWEYQQFIHALMIHLVNRYGMQEVSKWYFEQWCDPRLFEEGNPHAYFETFEAAYKGIKEVVPEARVGGNYDREYDGIDFTLLVNSWSTRSIQPDFLGIYCYQSRYLETDTEKGIQMMAEEKISYIYYYLKEKRKIMQACGMSVPVIVSEWNMTIVNRNMLNDSCYKGTFVMDTMIRIHDMADMIGYWFGTDLFVETEESPNLLDGCCGLLSYHAICKPAFYALDFLNRMGAYLLGKADGVMVSMNGYDNYMIACCNHKALDTQYYMQNEQVLTVEKIPAMFQERKRMRINVKINHVKNGLYYIKTRSISPKNGSVQDEWTRMGLVENLTEQDIEYLRRISTPKISIHKYSVTNQTLNISIWLDTHEMQCIHIFRQIIEPQLLKG